MCIPCVSEEICSITVMCKCLEARETWLNLLACNNAFQPKRLFEGNHYAA